MLDARCSIWPSVSSGLWTRPHEIRAISCTGIIHLRRQFRAVGGAPGIPDLSVPQDRQLSERAVDAQAMVLITSFQGLQYGSLGGLARQLRVRARSGNRGSWASGKTPQVPHSSVLQGFPPIAQSHPVLELLLQELFTRCPAKSLEGIRASPFARFHLWPPQRCRKDRRGFGPWMGSLQLRKKSFVVDRDARM